MIERFKKGYFARSKAGHDKDTLYVILDRDDRFVYLSDGRLKEVNNPKKKKEKHLQFIASQAEGIAAKLDSGLETELRPRLQLSYRELALLYNQNNQ